ncbi:hypothetical protein RHSIM_Rhsim07G0198600 [Rhododendron simsii]|uniref:Uncharacterized protein n=1 Tax=Rhododendron simsii TaxID=118357 RepID=A0A834LF32_RHOSS|nr:hypothetical protein RHSIM_Rhsim07G0198600 [Rhododendron simsii]
MAAALQQTPIAFHSRLPLSTRVITAKFHTHRATGAAPFNGGFSSAVRIPRPAVKTAGKKSRGGTLRVRAADVASESYASALSAVAVETGTLEATAADVEKVAKLFSDPEAAEFFNNPIIEIEEKREVVNQFASENKLQPHTANFINILIDNDRIELIDEILSEFEIAYNKLTDTEVAVVSSVVKLESQHLAQIAKGVQRLTGAKNVRIKTVIDPSLLAGFTVRYGHTGSSMIDMSVKKQLEDIAAQPDLMDLQFAL